MRRPKVWYHCVIRENSMESYETNLGKKPGHTEKLRMRVVNV